MSSPNQEPVFEYKFGFFGKKIKISAPEDLGKFKDTEDNKWGWLAALRDHKLVEFPDRFSEFHRRIGTAKGEWERNIDNEAHIRALLNGLKETFDNLYLNRRILHSSNPDAEFIFGLREQKGDLVAAGAYAFLVDDEVTGSGSFSPMVVNGMMEAFLYQHEISWSGETQRKVFDELKEDYTKGLESQESRLREIEKRNKSVLEDFAGTLKARSEALAGLEKEYKKVFNTLADEHEGKIKATLDTFNNKLALQAPVQYWEKKERFHKNRAIQFAVTLGIIITSFGTGLSVLVWKLLLDTPTKETPAHWRIGVLFVAAFLSVWIMRVFMRLFFSHHHLATDAAERSILIQTYLSLSKEGTPFAPDDKKLILTQVFRAASDGIVKDDAAPATPLELLTRPAKDK